MHEVEKQTEQKPDPVEITDPPTPPPAGGRTPSRPPDWRRVLLIAGTVLLALVVILTGTLLAFSHRRQPAKRATAVSQPAVNKQPVVGIRTLPLSTVKPIQSQVSQWHGSQITVAGDVAYVGSSTQAFYALRASDGSLLWSVELIGSAIVPPVVSEGAIYVTTFVDNSGPVYIFAPRATDGKQLWHYNTQSGLWNNLIIDQGSIYTTSHDGVAALQASDGKLLWDTPVKEIFSVSQISRVAGGLIYVSTYAKNGPGTLYALRARDGSVAWSYTDSSGIGAPVVIDGVVYSDSSDGLLAFRAATGALLWKRTIDGFPLMSNLQTENGTLYLLTQKMVLPTLTGQNTSPQSSLADLGALFSRGVQVSAAISLKEIHSTLYALDSI